MKRGYNLVIIYNYPVLFQDRVQSATQLEPSAQIIQRPIIPWTRERRDVPSAKIGTGYSENHTRIRNNLIQNGPINRNIIIMNYC